MEKEIFLDEDLEYREESELEIFEHGEKKPEISMILESIEKEPEKAAEIWKKGLEAEKILDELNGAKEELEIFERLSEIRGIPKEEIKEEILWALEKAETEIGIAAIMEENPGMNRKTAEELFSFRKGMRKKDEEKEKNGWDEKLKELDEFLARHYEEKIDKFDKEVVDEWESGIPLEKAFEAVRLIKENQRMIEEMEILKEEAEKAKSKAYAREHSSGSATSGAGVLKQDEFIEGLFREY